MYFIYLIILYSLTSCIIDNDGVSQPKFPQAKPLNSTFGKSLIEPGQIDSKTLVSLKNPKVSSAWVFNLDPFERIYSVDELVTFEPHPPYSFSNKLLNPPPQWMLSKNDICIGYHIVYDDVNNNGIFDNYSGYVNDTILSNFDLFSNQKDTILNELNNISVSEEYEIKTITGIESQVGFIYEYDNFKDTLSNQDLGHIITLYSRVLFISNTLQYMSKWEQFFQSRSPISYVTPQEGIPKISAEFKTKIQPTNDTTRFWINLKKYIRVKLKLEKLKSTVQQLKYDYYNSTSFNPNHDRLYGISRWYQTYYFSNPEQLDSAFSALSSGSLVNAPTLNIDTSGYINFNCDCNYSCNILPQNDSIFIDLSLSYDYLKGREVCNSTPTDTFFLHPDSLDAFAGKYAIFGYELFIIKKLNNVWLHIPRLKMFAQLITTGQNSFYSNEFKLQLESIQNGKSIKITGDILQSQFNTQTIVVQKQDATEPTNLLIQIDSLLTRKATSLINSEINEFINAYTLNENTKVFISSDSLSLFINHPGYFQGELLYYGEDHFFNPSTNVVVTFNRNPFGEITHLSYYYQGRMVDAPSISYTLKQPRIYNDQTYRSENSIIIEQNSGSTPIQSITNLNFSNCSDDGMLLNTTDANIMFNTPNVDSLIKLEDSGDNVIIKVTKWINKGFNLELNFCTENSAPETTQRISITQSDKFDGEYKYIADVEIFLVENNSLSVKYNALVFSSDTLFLKIQLHELFNHGEAIYLDSYILK